MDIQWYPGHMAKALRLMKEQLKSVDIVLVLGDARAVKASINSDFTKMLGNKRFIKVFNKADLADSGVNNAWMEYYKAKNEKVFFTDSINKSGLSELKMELKSLKENIRFERQVRAMVTGIPNVGKSMFINSVTGRGSAVTENRPGVTRANKWIKCGDFYLLDTPGVLPPKFTSERDAAVLAALGSVKDTVFDMEDISFEIIKFMSERYPENLIKRYSLEKLDGDYLSIYDTIGCKRGFKTKGGDIDYSRLSAMILKEFKSGLLGKISFDLPEDFNGN